MREGATPTTAAVPLGEYVHAFEAAVANDRPVLLLGLSSALSSSHEASLTARDMVMAANPAADIRVVDSLSASAALGSLVFEAASVLARGADIDELTAWAIRARTRVNGYFTLESLEHLARGGRIHDAVAFAGAMLDVRAMLRIDARGQLVLAGQARGRRKSMRGLVDMAAARVIDPQGQTAFIAHGDAPEDAETLRDMLLERVGFGTSIITEIGPVIGSHVGPGMLAVVFAGNER
jgi:DegV family protein with EDD domain